MSITLAIDTSTVVCAGLARGDEALVGEAIGDQTSHAELLADSVARQLDEVGAEFAEITRVVIGVGPGPFTGLRVGIATAKTLAWLGGVEPKGVCSLDVLALQYARATAVEGEFIIASDARRKELYWARYDASGRRLGDPQVTAPTDLPALPVGGPGAQLYTDVLAGGVASDAPSELDAAFMAAHIDDLADAGTEPLYLRKPDAEMPKTRKSTLTSGRLSLPKRGAR